MYVKVDIAEHSSVVIGFLYFGERYEHRRGAIGNGGCEHCVNGLTVWTGCRAAAGNYGQEC